MIKVEKARSFVKDYNETFYLLFALSFITYKNRGTIEECPPILHLRTSFRAGILSCLVPPNTSLHHLTFLSSPSSEKACMAFRKGKHNILRTQGLYFWRQKVGDGSCNELRCCVNFRLKVHLGKTDVKKLKETV